MGIRMDDKERLALAGKRLSEVLAGMASAGRRVGGVGYFPQTVVENAAGVTAWVTSQPGADAQVAADATSAALADAGSEVTVGVAVDTGVEETGSLSPLRCDEHAWLGSMVRNKVKTPTQENRLEWGTHGVGNARKIKARAPGQAQPFGDAASFLVMATQEISGLPFLCWVPDVQNFNGIVLRAVGDDMRQAPLQ